MNDDGEIVYGIGAIKGVGEGPREVVMIERELGNWKDFIEVMLRK